MIAGSRIWLLFGKKNRGDTRLNECWSSVRSELEAMKLKAGGAVLATEAVLIYLSSVALVHMLVKTSF